MEQEKRASLNADVMLRRALDLKAKNNKLIAEFMGISIDGEFAYIEDEGSPLEEVIPINKLNYHNSWDWLMPVVIKIGARGNLLAAMKNLRPHGVLRTIEDTHQAVVEFINEYNKNN